MTIINLEQRLRKIEAARARSDRSIRALSDEELAACLREASEDPADHAVAAWFLSGGTDPIEAGTLDTFTQEIRR